MAKYLSFWPRRTRSSPVRMTASTRYQINPNPVSRRPLRKERSWNSWVSLLLFPDLLTQVAFVADLANLMELRFQPIDVSFFGLQKTLEQLHGGIDAFVTSDLDCPVVQRYGFNFQLEIAFDLFLDVLPHGDLQQLGEVGRAVEKQDVFDKCFDVLHFNNGQLLDVAVQFVIVPVPAHLGVEEVLGDGRQLFLQCFIQ